MIDFNLNFSVPWMLLITLGWLALPFFGGFCIYLLPRFDRGLALGITIASVIYGLLQILSPEPFTIVLLDSFGVTLGIIYRDWETDRKSTRLNSSH